MRNLTKYFDNEEHVVVNTCINEPRTVVRSWEYTEDKLNVIDRDSAKKDLKQAIEDRDWGAAEVLIKRLQELEKREKK